MPELTSGFAEGEHWKGKPQGFAGLKAAKGDLEARSKAVFGVTNDIGETGYITPDGSMLDFTGRHSAADYHREGDRFVRDNGQRDRMGHRTVDHREVGEVTSGSPQPGALDGDAGMRALVNDGFVRVTLTDGDEGDDIGLEISRPMTRAQFRRITSNSGRLSTMTVDVVDAKGVTKSVSDNYYKVGVSNGSILRQAQAAAGGSLFEARRWSAEARLAEAGLTSLAHQRAEKAAYRVEHQLYRVESATLLDIRRELEVARKGTLAILSTATKDWQIAQAKALLIEIERQMKAWAAVSSSIATGRLPDVADLGVEQVMAALKGGGVGFSLGAAPMISRDFVAVSAQTMPQLITDVSNEVISKVGRILTRSVLAQRSPLDAMHEIGTLTGKGVFKSAFERGETILRTEYGRIAQTANHTTLIEFARTNDGLGKEWSAVVDGRTRPSHAAASGEVRKVDQAFDIGGYPALYPHDPRLPASESVACRCISVPWSKGWE